MTELQIHIEGGDLLQQESIRSTVREIYGAVRPTDRRVAERFYPAAELEWLPDETVRSALGVGNPVSYAELRPGEDVVDLGSGGGIDCLLAARAVGPTGSVVGVDFLAEMVARGRRAAEAAGTDNVRFVQAEIEDLPLADESVDVVISNGVPNLSPRKGRVMAEAYRVLRPGGRLAIVDLLLESSLPAEIQTHPAAWAGCLSGALSERAMYTALRRAGFRAVSIEPVEPFGIDECALYPLFTPTLLDLLRRLVPADRLDRITTSTLISARKLAAGEALPGRAPHDRASVGTSPHP
jgi:SAM-dependent methyltransferase